MALFFENIYLWGAIAAVFLFVGIVLFQATSKNSILISGIALAVVSACLGTVLVYYVQTDQKEIKKTIGKIADAVANNDTSGVLAYIAEDASMIQNVASTTLPTVHVEWTKIRDLKILNINHYTNPPVATVAFNATINCGLSEGGEGNMGQTFLIKFVEVDLIQESDSVWRVTDRCVVDRFGDLGNHFDPL